MSATADQRSAIAVVGMAGRVPGASGPREFWRNLRDGVESVRRLSREELLEAGLDEKELDNPSLVPAAAVIDGIDLFDAGFFGFTAREAELMDPQHRVFLELAWHALEDAGYDPARYDGAISVFGGGIFDSYATLNLLPAGVFDDKPGLLQTVLANEKDYMTSRVAYKLNLRGLACNVQSGCSTSLVAIHLACQSLLNFESDVALAGGVAIDVARRQGYYHHEGSVYSADGHCRAFDADASGTVFGNGAGMVVLKRLEDALADGDTIHAIVLGSAVNNDGSLKVGFTAPSVTGQSQVIAEALADAGVDPSTIGYVEAHGTGTALGDPIEIQAMCKAFGSTVPRASCAVGSVKTNIGHLDAAAGVSGFIKTVLALENRLIPPTLHFQKPNPALELDGSPFYIAARAIPWTSGTGPRLPRRAGVSSFGMGGTNAHVVLEEPPPQTDQPEAPRAHLIVLSARSREALDRSAANLADFLADDPGVSLADAAYTLQVGRAVFSHRLSVVCETTAEAAELLRPGAGDRARVDQHDGRSLKVAFMFPGQSRHHAGLGRELYETEGVFRDAVDACCDVLRGEIGTEVRPLLLEDDRDAVEAPDAAQPALFTFEYALAQLWRSWGVEPAACIGQGVGEHVAACVAGVFSLEDALRVVVARGRPIQPTPAPASDPALDAFGRVLSGVRLREPVLPIVSNVTGTWLRPEQATDTRYWLAQLRSEGRFADGLRTLAASDHRGLLEVGPGEALTAHARQAVPDGVSVPGVTRHPRNSERSTLLEGLATLWRHGAAVNWAGLHRGKGRRRVPLPGYPFERKRHWVEPNEGSKAAPDAKRPDITQWFYVPSWYRSVPLDQDACREAIAGLRVLVFDDGSPLAARTIRLLESSGHPVASVRAGEAFDCRRGVHFTIRPRHRDDYVEMLRELGRMNGSPEIIAHFWTAGNGAASLDLHQDLGFYSLLYLAQAMAEVETSSRVRVSVVTSELFDVLGGETLCPDKATLLGPCRVIPQEYRHVSCRPIDAAPDEVAAASTALVRQLVAEFAADAPVAEVAYRRGVRWGRTYEPLRLPARADGDTKTLRERGVYLITGAFGGIGLALARHLAAAYKARLVLIARQALPPEDRWTAYVERPDGNHQIAKRVRAVLDLRAAGADVLVVGADVTSESEMRRAVDAARSRFGRIDGVIHAAGVAGGGVIQLKTRDEAERVFASKIAGVRVLDRVLEQEPPDFVALCSSLTSIVGGAGQVDYCAANAYLNASAHFHSTAGRPTVAICWDTWSDAGMSVDTAVPAQLEAWKAERLRKGMSSAEGVEVFRRVLARTDLPQILTSTDDLYYKLFRMFTPPETEAAKADEKADRERLVEAVTDAAGELTATESAVVDIWRRVLGAPSVSMRDTFLDAGGNSLSAIQMVAQLRARFGVTVGVGEIIFQSVSQLAALCDARVDRPSGGNGTHRAGADGNGGGALDAALCMPSGDPARADAVTSQ